MFKNQRHLADKPIFDKQRFRKSESGIEVQVGHGKRILEHVPKAFLGIEQVQVRPERKHTLGQTLRHGNLKFHIGVARRGLRADGRAKDEVIILVQAEIRPAFELIFQTVGIKHLVGSRHNLPTEAPPPTTAMNITAIILIQI